MSCLCTGLPLSCQLPFSVDNKLISSRRLVAFRKFDEDSHNPCHLCLWPKPSKDTHLLRDPRPSSKFLFGKAAHLVLFGYSYNLGMNTSHLRENRDDCIVCKSLDAGSALFIVQRVETISTYNLKC